MSLQPALHKARAVGHEVRNAWIAIALFLPVMLGGMVLGESLVSNRGYGPDDAVPLGTALIVGVPVMLLIALPPAIGAWLGWRAYRRGDQRGVPPAVVGGTLAAFTVVTNLGGLVLSALVG